MAKTDIKQADRNIQIHPADRYLLGMKWEGQTFIDTVLPLGLCSAPVGRGLRDVTRRQYIKYSTGKLLFLPFGLTIKKTRRMASAKCSRATTGFSTSCGRGKYWLIYQKLGGQEKRRPFSTVGLKCCTAIPENANTCAANTYRLALLIVIQSYLQNRGRGSVKG